MPALDMNPFGSRDDDPLLQDDPFAPPGEKDGETDEQPGAEQEQEGDADGLFASNGDPPEETESVFAPTSSSATESETASESSSSSPESEMISRADLLSYLLENRAALDVLFEMMAFNQADGGEEGYRHFLSAMRDRHEVALQQYREALTEEFPDADLSVEASSSIGDDPPLP